MNEEMAKEQPSAGTTQKALTVTLFVVMAAIGVTNIVIGFLNCERCGNAMVLPVMLLVNGVLWVIPVLMLTVINCVRHDADVSGIYGFLEKLFFIAVVFLVASTIYVLVSATQVKTLDFLCANTWVPPYTLAIIIVDWVCFVAFFRLFCVHEFPPEEPPMEFKHLKNLPPLGLRPWNRHRVMRSF